MTNDADIVQTEVLEVPRSRRGSRILFFSLLSGNCICVSWFYRVGAPHVESVSSRAYSLDFSKPHHARWLNAASWVGSVAVTWWELAFNISDYLLTPALLRMADHDYWGIIGDERAEERRYCFSSSCCLNDSSTYHETNLPPEPPCDLDTISIYLIDLSLLQSSLWPASDRKARRLLHYPDDLQTKITKSR